MFAQNLRTNSEQSQPQQKSKVSNFLLK